MDSNLSSRFKQRSTRGHVRRQKQSLPNWALILLGLIALIALALIIRQTISWLSGDDDITNGEPSNRTWLTEGWTLNDISDDNLQVLVDRLAANKIDMVYVQTGQWRASGEYRENPFAQQFRQQLKEAAPDLKVLDWITVQEAEYSDTTSQASAVNYARRAIDEWGYDGVHIRGFSVFTGDQNYVRFLRILGEVIEAPHILSVTVPPDLIPTNPDVPRAEGNPSISWQTQYKEQIAILVDEIVVMAHSSSLQNTEDYRAWVAYQVETYANDIDRIDIDVEIIVAIPTYPESFGHNPAVENVQAASEGAREGIRQAGDSGNRVVGAGLFVHDEATSLDWDTFQGIWADR
jgi:hypothetical protein